MKLFLGRASETLLKRSKLLKLPRNLSRKGTRMLVVEKLIELYLHLNLNIYFLGNGQLEKLSAVEYSRECWFIVLVRFTLMQEVARFI